MLVKRLCFVLKVKELTQDEVEEEHDQIWVLKSLRDSGWLSQDDVYFYQCLGHVVGMRTL